MAHALSTVPPVVRPVERVLRSHPGRTSGYVAAIVVNAGILYVARHLLEWSWPDFVTPAWAEVLDVVTVSLVATIVANLAFLVYDHRWFRSLALAVTSGVGLLATLRVYQVFPFDFSMVDIDPTPWVKLALLIGIFGSGVACFVHTVRFLTAPVHSTAEDDEPPGE